MKIKKQGIWNPFSSPLHFLQCISLSPLHLPQLLPSHLVTSVLSIPAPLPSPSLLWRVERVQDTWWWSMASPEPGISALARSSGTKLKVLEIVDIVSIIWYLYCVLSRSQPLLGYIPKLSFNFNFNLVESWDSFIPTWSSHPPPKKVYFQDFL